MTQQLSLKYSELFKPLSLLKVYFDKSLAVPVCIVKKTKNIPNFTQGLSSSE